MSAELAAALAKAQSEFPPIERRKTVTVTTKTGGQYKFAYAPLDEILAAVKPALSENGLALSQLLSNLDGKPALRTMLLHASGGFLEDICPLPVNGGESAQEIGSAITYLRRYAAVAILGIATEEDDDGNAASGNRRTSGAAPPTDGRENPSPVSSEAKAAPEASPAQLAHIKALISDCAKLRKTTQKAVTDALVNDGYSLTGLSDAKAGELVTKLETWQKNLAKA